MKLFLLCLLSLTCCMDLHWSPDAKLRTSDDVHHLPGRAVPHGDSWELDLPSGYHMTRNVGDEESSFAEARSDDERFILRIYVRHVSVTKEEFYTSIEDGLRSRAPRLNVVKRSTQTLIGDKNGALVVSKLQDGFTLYTFAVLQPDGTAFTLSCAAAGGLSHQGDFECNLLLSAFRVRDLH